MTKEGRPEVGRWFKEGRVHTHIGHLSPCQAARWQSKAMNSRPESGSPPGSPEPSLPWSPPCARTPARAEVEFQRLWAAHAAGKAGSPPPPPRRQPAFPRRCRAPAAPAALAARRAQAVPAPSETSPHQAPPPRVHRPIPIFSL